MNNALIVSYDPFAMESRVSIMTNGHQEQVQVCSDINELAEQLVGLAYSNNIYEIKIHGPFATVCEIKRTVNEYEKNQYSSNKILIEGI